MRLVNTETLKLEEFTEEHIPKYALLSHRWEDDEVTYHDMQLGREQSRKGCAKLYDCCRCARNRGISHVWIDTCCIDKSSSAELSEAINSMYYWYATGEECYAYLYDVSCDAFKVVDALEYPDEVSSQQIEFANSVWFTRGWTLQELIAPPKLRFFNNRWEELGTKESFSCLISSQTGIDWQVLIGRVPPWNCSIAQRMSWASKRQTSRLEDRAYSLFGIFNVNMALLYGERESAFRRLQEEIIKHNDDHTIFAWSDRRAVKSMLAPSPDCFTGMQNQMVSPLTGTLSEGHSIINVGLSIKLVLIPWAMETYLAPLNCAAVNGSGLVAQTGIFLRKDRNRYYRTTCDHKDLVLGQQTLSKFRGYSQSPIFVGLTVPASFKHEDIGFYGFVFEFSNYKPKLGGYMLSQADVLCMYHFDFLGNSKFQIGVGDQHTAGVFRFKPGLRDLNLGTFFMYFGLDDNFHPLCLVTQQYPPGFYSLCPQNSDLSQCSQNDKTQLLNLKWMLDYASQTEHQGGGGSCARWDSTFSPFISEKSFEALRLIISMEKVYKAAGWYWRVRMRSRGTPLLRVRRSQSISPPPQGRHRKPSEGS